MTAVEVLTTVDRVRAIASQLAARVDEIESARTLPPAVVEQLTAAGCFRSLVPRRLGGDESTLVEHVELICELAAIDGSLGWTVAIGSSMPALAGNLPAPSLQEIYAAGPDVIGAGAFNPTGSAVPVPGGYRANGRWSFASGCLHADWFLAHCVVGDGRVPPLRVMIVPAAAVEILDTWWSVGMCGTGSHDFTLDDVFVADAWTFSIFEAAAHDDTLLRVPELCLSTISFAAVALGIAAGARREIADLATDKVPMLSPTTLAANPLFRNELGRADAALRAAGALLRHDATDAWARATAGEPFDDEVRAGIRTTAAWVAETAVAVVDAAYRAGGGSAVYRTSPLQRRLRDIHALTQHFALKPDTFTLAGAVLAGEDVDTSLL